MWSDNSEFQEELRREGLVNGIYLALEKDDPAELVMKAKDAVERINKPCCHVSCSKSDDDSKTFRIEGNAALSAGNAGKALMYYNSALLYAPKNSHAMKLAYSNRSAILYKFELYEACLADIETCFALGCPDDIKQKLMKRKEDCLNRKWQDDLMESMMSSRFSEEFFQLHSRNPQIPCASTSVGVRMHCGVPNIVAAKDIEVGTVVAVEPAFVSSATGINTLISCFYCQKLCMNLMPCDNCCSAMFCSETCQGTCNEEYHNIECKFIDFYKTIPGGNIMFALKAALKIKKLCSSWEEFETASKVTGIDRMKNSSVEEIFDVENKFSLLCFDDRLTCKYGSLYNYSFDTAVLLYRIDKMVPDFLPQKRNARKVAMMALARVVLKLGVYAHSMRMIETMENREEKSIGLHYYPNRGMLSLTGKLKHDCNPNLLVVSLNKKVALVAIKPIQKETELTVSLVNTMLMQEPILRKVLLFKEFNWICNKTCYRCQKNYNPCLNQELTNEEKESFRKLKPRKVKIDVNTPVGASKYFKKVCNTLGILHNKPDTDEYHEVTVAFDRCMYQFVLNYTKNVVLGKDIDDIHFEEFCLD